MASLLGALKEALAKAAATLGGIQQQVGAPPIRVARQRTAPPDEDEELAEEPEPDGHPPALSLPAGAYVADAPQAGMGSGGLPPGHPRLTGQAQAQLEAGDEAVVRRHMGNLAGMFN